MIIDMIKAKRTCNKRLCSSLNAASIENSNDIKQYDHVAPEKKFREYCQYWEKERWHLCLILFRKKGLRDERLAISKFYKWKSKSRFNPNYVNQILSYLQLVGNHVWDYMYRFLKNKIGISWKIKIKKPKNSMCFMNNEVTCFLLKPIQIKKLIPILWSWSSILVPCDFF